MNGLSEDETSLLRLIFVLTPWKRDRVSKAVGAFLDGDDHALDELPALRDQLTKALDNAGYEA